MRTWKIIVFSLLPALSLAQSGPISQVNPEGAPVSFITRNIDYADIKANGSQYFDEEFAYGEVFSKDSVVLRAEMRFNAFRNEIQVLQQGDESYPLLKRSYIMAKIGAKRFNIYIYEDARGNNRSSYFNPLNEGNAVLLYKPEIKLKQGRIPATSYDRTVPPTYIDISAYYIRKGDGIAKRIRLKKIDILEVLEDKKSEIQAYIKGDNLSVRKEADLIKIMDYYNSL
ncbi:hypothetical protein [uncultured Eudoraea sp.]|uniref:hypothetical protein n=1 Tax=uncultured Eudoraea sp. TaxID=1035614 RepID=UPI00262F0CA3|nr:hypothetical protein [uncultured Eudoraea sp.]